MEQKILDVAAQLINKYGLRKFTIDEISSSLKISKKTIYHYFKGKDDIIRKYFEATIESDKKDMVKALDENNSFFEKVHNIVHSTHKYSLSVPILNEAKLFYPEEWDKIESLKKFKINAISKILNEAADNGTLKPGINLAVLAKVIRETSNVFTDYDFLIENKLKASEAMDEFLKIMFYGILSKTK